MNHPKETPTKDEELATIPSRQPGQIQDAVFGTVHEDGPDYRSVSSITTSRASSNKLTLVAGWVVGSVNLDDED